MAEEKTIEINMSQPVEKAEADIKGEQNEYVNSKFLETNRVKKHFTSAPTYVPKNFNEQIVFFDDGTNKIPYVYINGAWQAVRPQFIAGKDTVSGSATKTITTGFRPRHVRATAFASSSEPGSSVGISWGHWSEDSAETDNQGCISDYSTTSRYYVGYAIKCFDDAAANGESGKIGNITSTGFDIVFTEAGTGSCTFIYEAFN